MTATLPRLRGATRVPGDKSVAHRALILAGMAGSESTITGAPDGGDVMATRDALERLGVRFEGPMRALRVLPPPSWTPGLTLDARNSGTTARLLAGALCARRCTAILTGDESLMLRPMERVAAPLRALGAVIDTTGGKLPMAVRASNLASSSWEARVASGQIKSAFLLAALGASGESWYREPVASRDHLERMFPAFGITCRDDEGTLRVRGGRPRGARIAVPGDASSAATLLVAAALLPGSELTVEGVLLNPLRLGFVDVLSRMGVPVSVHLDPSLPGPESSGSISVRAPRELSPATVSPSEIPRMVDEIPLLVLAAAFAPGESRFEGLAELRVKESDRIHALVAMLEAMGVSHELEADALTVRGAMTHRACELEARGDHRIAMLNAIAALRQPGLVTARDPCVDVSWPGFHDRLASLVSS